MIALAGKKIESQGDPNTMKREELEGDLEFYGLLILGGMLKDKTLPTIIELQNAKIRTVMATGDNIQTAISIAKKCKILHTEPTIVENVVHL